MAHSLPFPPWVTVISQRPLPPLSKAAPFNFNSFGNRNKFLVGKRKRHKKVGCTLNEGLLQHWRFKESPNKSLSGKSLGTVVFALGARGSCLLFPGRAGGSPRAGLCPWGQFQFAQQTQQCTCWEWRGKGALSLPSLLPQLPGTHRVPKEHSSSLFCV